MKNRKWMICLTSAILLCGCGKKEENVPVPSAEPAGTPAESTEPAAQTPDTPAPETPEPEPELITLEEFRESNEAVTGTDLFGVHILELNGEDKHIYGQLYLPTEDRESYPLVIISHGIQGSYYDLVDQAGKCVDAGLAAYIFDYCGGSTYSRSSGDISDMSVLTECDDLEFVLNELWQYSFMDRENTYLMGESQGGMVSAVLAAERPQDIAGMVLLYPAFNIPDMAREVYVEGQSPEELYAFNVPVGHRYFTDVLYMDAYETISGYDGNILIIHGSDDQIVPQSYSQLAMDVYNNAELEIIPGAGHGFQGDLRAQTFERAAAFIRNLADRQ
ncbi:MAG: alpha/beta fold hydrolase [Erysipelotrichaceae bacterium]|nr:alpha/beta fold hydrolase [Erysipelotrichaceae bacterium]